MRAFRFAPWVVIALLSIACKGASSKGDASSGGEDGGAWTESSSWAPRSLVGEGFTVALPRPPRRMEQPIETPNGTVVLTSYMVEYADAAFAVFYSPRPSPEALDETLDKARDGVVANLGGKLVSEERVTVGGVPARDLRIATPDGSTSVVSRLILTDERMYQLTTVMPKANADHPAIGWFFGSFAFTASP